MQVKERTRAELIMLQYRDNVKQSKITNKLGVKVAQEGILNAAMKGRNCFGRNAIALLYSIPWDNNITNGNEKRTCNIVVKNVTTYGSEIRVLKDATGRILGNF